MKHVQYQDLAIFSIVFTLPFIALVIFATTSTLLALVLLLLYLLLLTISFLAERKIGLLFFKSNYPDKLISLVNFGSICLGIFFALALPIIMVSREQTEIQVLLSFEMLVVVSYIFCSWTFGSILARHLFRRKQIVSLVDSS